MSKKIVQYPYLPKGKEIRYVPESNVFMQLAKAFARAQSLDAVMPGAAVVVKDGRVIGIGANGSDYHKTNTCQRIILGCKSGEGYEHCEGCHPKNHSEATAVYAAQTTLSGFFGVSLGGADLYLWGHWWFCKACWDVMIAAGITNGYVVENSEILFNKEHPDNIVGKQFQV